METTPSRDYRFDGFSVDLARRQLVGPDGRSVPLSARAYDALVYLVANHMRVVGKDELMKAVWPNVVVEENNLNQAISALRRALGDQRESARFIATIAGRGYQFVAKLADPNEPVSKGVPATGADPTPLLQSPAVGAQSRRAWLAGLAALAAAGIGIVAWQRAKPPGLAPSIAVLPFRPLVEDTANAPLEFGMADALINRLSSVTGVVVTPFSSVRTYTARDVDPLMVGRTLRVAAVLESNVQVLNGRVRVTSRLLDVDSGTALWSGRFDERLSDFFSVQDALAEQVVSALEVRLTSASRRTLSRHATDDWDAWEHYLKGRFQWATRTETGLRKAIEHYRAALAIDPEFALAAAGLADAWSVLGVFNMVPPSEAFAEAHGAAERAIALDAELAEAHAALGHVLVQGQNAWRAGEAEYRRAFDLKPTYGQVVFWIANHHCYLGRMHEALDYARRAQTMEPMSVAFAANVGLIQYFARDYAGAAATLTHLVNTVPQYVLARRILARVRMAEGRVADALTLLDGFDAEGAPGAFADLGRAFALMGRRQDAEREVSRLEALGARGFGVGNDLAMIQASLGDHELALATLERRCEDRSQMIGFLNSEPAFDPIRETARFKAVSRRLGLS